VISNFSFFQIWQLKKKFKNPFVGFANLFFLSLGGENLPQKETLVVTHKKT